MDNSDNSVNKNSDFIIKLYTEKGVYNEGEQIGCYATVQYAYFGGIRTVIPEASGQHFGNIRTA
jgi:hypothetical protein